jgi:hypothetical protein
MHRWLARLYLGLGLLVGCQSAHERQPPSPGAAHAAEPAGHGKPSAPVDVSIAVVALGGDVYEVTLTARPTADVDALALTLDGETVDVGATARGEARTLTRHLRLEGAPGRQIHGDAATGTGNHRRARAAAAQLGAAPAAPARPRRDITLPDGTVVREVRQ